jgi:hypothetical protein
MQVCDIGKGDMIGHVRSPSPHPWEADKITASPIDGWVGVSSQPMKGRQKGVIDPNPKDHIDPHDCTHTHNVATLD